MTIWEKYSSQIPERPKYNNDKELFDRQMKKWTQIHSKVVEKYKHELFELAGIQNHVNRDKIFNFCLELEEIYDRNGIYDTTHEKPLETILLELVRLFYS